MLVMSLLSCSAMRNDVDFFDNPRFTSQANVTTLNVPMFLVKPFIKRHLKNEGESEEVIELIRKISRVRVMTIENPSQEINSDFNSFLQNNRYEDWFSVNSDGEKIHLHARKKGDDIRKLVFSVKSDDQLVFIDISGLFTAEDLSKLVSNLSEKNTKK